MTDTDRLEQRLEQAASEFKKLDQWKQDLLEEKLQQLASPISPSSTYNLDDQS